ncbi:MAG: hypothetical protein JRG91_07340 [Deltaproteobacteria bacterium]|nr:hypothetical protein [Deltaproteobacteria bacterium]
MRGLIPLAALVLASCGGPHVPVENLTHGAEPTFPLTIDFLEPMGLTVNGAGPVLVMADPIRPRIIAAHTLSSSLSVIDTQTSSVTNIPLSGRAFQHLKSESLVIAHGSGDVYLVGTSCFHIAFPATGASMTVETGAQMESIAVDEATGNVFVAGRESKEMGFYDAARQEYRTIPWLEDVQKLLNVNQTPPPPIRKVVADAGLGKIIALDGYTSTLHFFDGKSGEHLESRPVPLTSGGRWHLAGYDHESHALFIVTETKDRRVIEAARLGVTDGKDVVVALPELKEGVGMTYNPKRDEVYIPYDNHPTVHVVRFEGGGFLEEIMIPAFGNDASAIDAAGDTLYIGSWAHGEIDVIDLESRTLTRRIENLGIIPHMFTLALDPLTNRLYFPRGASAVNGTFGAALTVVDPATGQVTKIRTGWAPIDLIEMPSRDSFLVFSSEDQFAEVRADGTSALHDLPHDYPVMASPAPDGDVYLSYGPHQSYWPVVYIWGARNGILTIDDDLGFYDRRIFRQALDMVLDENGALTFTQNNWGGEEQFLGVLADPVREFQASMRLPLTDQVTREITQRVLEYDEKLQRLYLVRAGEKDEDPSILQIIDPSTKQVLQRIELGLAATDLVHDDTSIYVSNFGSNTVSIVDKTSFAVTNVETGDRPLRLGKAAGSVYVINHAGQTLQQVGGSGTTYDLPHHGLPDNLFTWNDTLVVTSHDPETLIIEAFDPGKGSFSRLHEESYPYGDTRFDSINVSFYLTGQFGDAVMSITQGREDTDGRLWVTDFLSGRLVILEPHAP